MVPAGNALWVLSSLPQADHIPPAKNQRDKKAQRFFRDEAIHAVCRVSEKLLQLAPQGHFLRGVDGTFCDAIKIYLLYFPISSAWPIIWPFIAFKSCFLSVSAGRFKIVSRA